ncbi:MAG: thiamine phosphate synthase [Chloroflexota bacterium]|nr:thiamine phosphate synthase [Chloroflexota bacterium]
MTPSEPRERLRIIDANLNRTGEGLRFLEDIARLELDDAALTLKLKTMRHQLLESDWAFQRRLLGARNSEGDVGASTKTPGGEKQREMPIAVVANTRRVQESLRVLEEMAKVSGTDPGLDPQRFKQARFDLYTIEQTLLARLMRQDKVKRLPGVYVILDIQALNERSPIEMAGQVIRGGARVIQLRDKLHSKKELLPLARELRKLCAECDVLFIVNDFLDLALAADADGLHLGQDDLPVTVARKLLPIDKILGCSTRTVEQAAAAEAEGADYIAVGSIYPTTSKETAGVVGLERLRQIRKAVTLPLVAIGGITRDNAAEAAAAGAEAVAVISAVLQARSPEEATRQLTATLEARE